jgi:hypothetical protein
MLTPYRQAVGTGTLPVPEDPCWWSHDYSLRYSHGSIRKGMKIHQFTKLVEDDLVCDKCHNTFQFKDLNAFAMIKVTFIIMAEFQRLEEEGLV